MKILRLLHTGYGLVTFAILFILAFPFFLIPIFFPKYFNLIGIINRWWARALFAFCFIPVSIIHRTKLDPRKQYIFCANHFSYVDIPTLGLAPRNAIFVGKNDMENIPGFGFMYRNLHITVDRTKLKSRYTTLKRSLDAIDEGKSLIIFPEGGIITEREPVMARFKDGAFRVAIEKQIEIVPVTIPYNWIILPADQFVLHWHQLKVIFHKPLPTQHLTLADIDLLKEETRQVIETELHKHLKHMAV